MLSAFFDCVSVAGAEIYGYSPAVVKIRKTDRNCAKNGLRSRKVPHYVKSEKNIAPTTVAAFHEENIS
jgi:hypothetical protein